MTIGYDYDGVLTEPGWFDRLRADLEAGKDVAILTTNTQPERIREEVAALGLDVPVIRFKRSDLTGKAEWLAARGGGVLYDDQPRYGEPCAALGVRWVRV